MVNLSQNILTTDEQCSIRCVPPALYGGNPEDWYKITSIQAFVINGASVQVHWFENAKLLQQVELKFKRQYPKIAPKNL